MSLLKRIGGTDETTGAAPTPSVNGNNNGTSNNGAASTTIVAAPPESTPNRSGGLSRLRAEYSPASSQAQINKQDKVTYELKTRIQERLIAELERKKIPVTDDKQVKSITEEIFQNILAEEPVPLSRVERQNLLDAILSEIMGFGPLDPLLRDDSISEIMVNSPKQIYIERKGKLVRVDITFQNNEHVMRILERIVAPLGRRLDESSPMVDARLPDGSRVNAIIPPIALKGPSITIRKFSKKPLTIEDLIKFGSMTPKIAEFLKGCVESRLNIIVSGGTGSGKTTLLNVLSNFIPDDERIVTVENAAELQLWKDHVVTLESRPANVEGRGEISIRDLVINCLRMRPDRIVVGECRGGEALDMLQAMNTGHDGSLTTAHANSPKDTISRLETMCLMAGMDLPVRAIRDQIASAVNVIVQQERMQDGSRKIVSITEVDGMEGDVIKMNEIFRFEQTGLDENNKVMGTLRPTGVQPRFLERFEKYNIFLPPDTFGSSNQLRPF
ncbi:MAG: CpaF family protein [Chloroflexi bacterium]|nr:CpaF family protein [Chloroflexota bacterium]